MSNNKTSRNKLKLSAVIIFALLVVNSTIVLLYNNRQAKPEAFFARNMNDASYDCEEKIRNKYQHRLVSSYFDDLSSRYEANKRQYVVYYRINIREEHDKAAAIREYMAKCIIWERLGYVSDFSVFEP